jgi:hypothetical protein
MTNKTFKRKWYFVAMFVTIVACWAMVLFIFPRGQKEDALRKPMLGMSAALAIFMFGTMYLTDRAQWKEDIKPKRLDDMESTEDAKRCSVALDARFGSQSSIEGKTILACEPWGTVRRMREFIAGWKARA